MRDEEATGLTRTCGRVAVVGRDEDEGSSRESELDSPERERSIVLTVTDLNSRGNVLKTEVALHVTL